jgi:drug/metabolite transporter (DMT)-like permease
MLKSFTEEKKGYSYIILESFIWAFFPIITILGIKDTNSIVALFWTTFFSMVFFFLLLIFRNKFNELKDINVWKYSLGISLFIGVIFYGLYFLGLERTNSINGAIVGKFEIITSFIFFQIFKKQSLSKKHITGIILATLGALLIFIPNFGKFYIGDIFILLATFFPPIGNWYQQKARQIASSETILFLRTLITSLFLFIFIVSVYSLSGIYISNTSLIWLLVNGIIILGFSILLWVEGIHRINVTKALTIASLSPLVTMLFSWLILNQKPNMAQLLSFPLIILGILLITDFRFKKF